MSGRLLKVEASGNDFLLGVGGWALRLAEDPELVAGLCHRRRGIGADGVLAVEAESSNRARLRYRNADGSFARFCGNGSRCAARAAVELLDLPHRLILGTDWVAIPAEVNGSTVTLELPSGLGPARPVALEVVGRRWAGWWLEVGVPHLVLPVDDLAGVDVVGWAPPLRRHTEVGPDGANVSFVERQAPGSIEVRTYERGVEGETLCCGSAVVAAALIELASGATRSVAVHARSGDELVVEAAGDPFADPIRFTGPTRFVADVEPTAELLTQLNVQR